MKSLLGETSGNTNMLPSEIWLHVYFLWCNCFRYDNDVFCKCGEYTKVVDNVLILLVLKFHDLRPDGLGVIDFRSSLSDFCMLSVQI